ncbi:protoheme IX farnesyltransferase [Catalinimonas alkaloidigena]|uniref:Protoheme IX farnesyltransferase n=1 Tax=Catalinimonas alkaloidigena TaxID=1075417 RepID=A0A1G9BI20_9BACT|nr:heme o synthase [Catalinimonas alkaloidigena]SDK39176.1 protoheme IX farnesyltransferase [Catalinimonas alkaloidigena]
MIAEKARVSVLVGLAAKTKDYVQLLKLRLSLVVVFSAGITYLMAQQGTWDLAQFVLFCLGGLLVTGAANIINQVWERDLDKLMRRTMDRPLPTGRLTPAEAITFGSVIGVVGLLLLSFNGGILAALLSFLSMLLYGFVYTPMKVRSPLAVLVGALPGAMPPLIGWAAATGTLGLEALILFGIQFVWQFPHFWAIAWVADEDYRRAGFKLLPSGGGRDLNTAFQIMIYTLLLLPLGLMPALLGITGLRSAIIATICGTLFLIQTFQLMRDGSRKSALRIMFGSFLYLPIVQIAYLWDKV